MPRIGQKAVKKKTTINLINDFSRYSFPLKPYKSMIYKIISGECIPVHNLSIITVNDEYLKKMNKKYLNQNTYTDVMTFKMEEKSGIEAEIYISLDRAEINARQYKVALKEEFARLVIHGLLHIKGFDDRIEAEKNSMKLMEDRLLKKYWIN